MYNKENRLYASNIIKNDLHDDSQRTVSDISSEIFAHQFLADVIKHLSIFSPVIPRKWDIYSRLSEVDVNDGEKRIKLFNTIERVFEWE